MVHQKVIAEREILAGQMKFELKRIYDETLILAQDFGYRFKPSESHLGWFEILDGNNKTVSIICPVGMVDPSPLCQQWAETSINLVKDCGKWEAFNLIPEIFTCDPIHQQQNDLIQAKEVQQKIDDIAKDIRQLNDQIEEKKKSLESLNWQLSRLG